MPRSGHGGCTLLVLVFLANALGGQQVTSRATVLCTHSATYRTVPGTRTKFPPKRKKPTTTSRQPARCFLHTSSAHAQKPKTARNSKMARRRSASSRQEIQKQHETGVTVTNFREEESTESSPSSSPACSTRRQPSYGNSWDWPNGSFLLACLEQKEALDLNSDESNGKLNSSSQQQEEDLVRDPNFWQANARRALLHKYGHLSSSADYDDAGMPTSRNVRNVQEIETIQTLWKHVVESALSSSANKNTNETCNNNDEDDDLVEFIRSQCQQSNHRNLQWSGMHCQPGTQFQLHAHPNLELVYCCQGALHEIRMLGDPLTKSFDRDGEDAQKDHHQQQAPNQQQCGVQGPNLTTLQRSWKFATLPAGRWLVNEVGSIHKSFTSTARTGCQLLALWGGSHANIIHPPVSVNIQGAVDATDQQIVRHHQLASTMGRSASSSACYGDCTNWANISQTFLPESERRSASY